MGLNYSYNLYVRPDKLAPILEWIREHNDGEVVIFDDSSLRERSILSEDQAADRLREFPVPYERAYPFVTDPYYLTEVRVTSELSLLFDTDEEIERYFYDVSRYSGCNTRSIEEFEITASRRRKKASIGMIALNISHHDDPPPYSDYLHFDFRAVASSMSLLFAASESIRSAFASLAEKVDAFCCLLDKENSGSTILRLNGRQYCEDLGVHWSDLNSIAHGLRLNAFQRNVMRLYKQIEIEQECRDLAARIKSEDAIEYIRPVQVSDEELKKLVVALTSPSVETRIESASQLGRVRKPEAFEPLQQLFRSDLNEDVQLAVLQAIQHIGVPSYADYSDFEFALEACGPPLRRLAASTVGQGYEDVLVSVLSDPDAMTRGLAVLRLGELRCILAVDDLSQKLFDKSNTPVYAIVRALVEIYDRDAVSHLIRLLREGETEEARCLAVFALEAFGGPEVVQSLQNALNDPSILVQREALAAIDKMQFVPIDD